jgi:thiol-disulfide isomerase/thioredoxin
VSGTPGTEPRKERSGLQALGAAALAFLVVMAFTSDLCAPRSSPLVGLQAPPFAREIVGGEGAEAGDRIDLAALRGRTVVLDFWASWCPPCRASVPALEAFARAHPEVTVVGVDVETNRGAAFVRSAHASLGATYPTIHDADGTLQQAYSIQNLPTLLVLDGEGVVREAHVGAVDAGWLEAHVR